jgi:sugar O-acyltransferase (sialic acid O-acetyltransferase NeuD family)
MKNLIIIGARGWGREVYAAVIDTKAYRNGEVIVKGFLDSKSDAFEGLKGNYPPILGAPETYEIQEDDVFFVAMGEPKWRKHYAEMMEAKGAKFLTIICTGSYVNSTATIGEGSFVAGWSCVSDNVILGKHTIVHTFCDLGHDVKVGNYSSIEAYSFLGGYAEVGEESVMHVRSTLIRHKKIGNQVSVGSSSVVMRNVKDGLHVFGNPARRIDY